MTILIIIAVVVGIFLLSKIQPKDANKPVSSHTSTNAHKRLSASRKFSIAGLSHRCTKKDIGCFVGKVAYEPTNKFDKNAIAIIANAEQADEKLVGYIPKDYQTIFKNFAYNAQELPCVGFIDEFINDEGKRMLFGKIRVYDGEDADVETDMKEDLNQLSLAFSKDSYHKEQMLENW